MKGRSTTASAGVWDNVRKNPNSVRAQSELMLQGGAAKLVILQKSPQCCSMQTCCSNSNVKLKFTSHPAKYLDNYSDKATCSDLERTTTATPLSFQARDFSSISQIVEWFSDFSAGKGVDGKDLYQRCSGSCSPQYTLLIEQSTNGFTVNPEAICGQARDKDDNNFVLQQEYVWSCNK